MKIFLTLLVFLLMFFGGNAHHEVYASERQRVLVISSYHPAFPTFYRQNLGVRQGLSEQGFDGKSMDLDYEFMDSKRFFDEENLGNFSASLSYKISQLTHPYDVVLVADDNALDFALEHRNDLFAQTPVIFFGVNNVNKALLLDTDPQVTGVVEAISIDETFELIKHIHTRDIDLQVVVDGTPSGQSNLKSLTAHQIGNDLFNIESLDLSKMTYQQLSESLSANEGNAVIMLSGYKDVSGESKDFYQLASFVATHSASPVYHFWRHGIGEGLFGGKVVSHHEQGRIAGVMAGEVLSGRKVADLPVISKSPNVFMFDYALLDQYNIPESAIPVNTHWMNKPPTFKESNPQMYWLTMAALLIAVMVIVGLLWVIWIRRRVSRRLEQAYQKKNSELEKTYSDLLQSEKMAALGRLVAGVAHEINTPVGVGVTTTTHLQALFDDLEKEYSSGGLSKRKMESFIDDCKEGSEILMSSLSGAARLISSFKQVAVDQSNEKCREINLSEYLDAVVTSLKPKLKLKNVEVHMLVCDDIMLRTYPGAVSQVMTNLILNSLIHGFEGRPDNNQIIIKATKTETGVDITCQDNGIGMDEATCDKVFDPFFTTKLGQGGSGLGLNIVYNLVRNKLKGDVTCESKPGKGTTFVLSITQLSEQMADIQELTDIPSHGQVFH